jgi:hypothetical protein
MDREIWIEQVRKADAIGFRHQPQQRAVTVERPWPAFLDHFEGRLFGAEHQPVAHLCRRILEGDLDRLIAEPFDLHDLGEPTGRKPRMLAPAFRSSRRAIIEAPGG